MEKTSLTRITGFLAAASMLGVLLAACSGEAAAPTQSTQPAATPVPTRTAAPAQTAAPTQPTAVAPQPTSAPPPAATPGGPAREISVVLKDNIFPESMEFTVGEKVRFTITNDGSVQHTYEFTDFDILWQIEPRETNVFEWTVPNAPGEYDCGCYLSGEDPAAHEGMAGLCTILQGPA